MLAERIHAIGWTATPDGCWEWKGSRNENGYGVITIRALGLMKARVHRLIYRDLHGLPLADDEELRHRCDNPPCVRVDHLIPGSHAENVQDMMDRGRHYLHGATRCRQGHDITLPGALLANPRANGAKCAECARDRARESNTKRQAYKNEWRRRRRAEGHQA